MKKFKEKYDTSNKSCEDLLKYGLGIAGGGLAAAGLVWLYRKYKARKGANRHGGASYVLGVAAGAGLGAAAVYGYEKRKAGQAERNAVLGSAAASAKSAAEWQAIFAKKEAEFAQTLLAGEQRDPAARLRAAHKAAEEVEMQQRQREKERRLKLRDEDDRRRATAIIDRRLELTHSRTTNRHSGIKPSGLGWTPDIIVLHTTGGSTGSAINHIFNGGENVSYHFVIDGHGTITQLVDIKHQAHANGTARDIPHKAHSESGVSLVVDRDLCANLYTVSIGFGDMKTSGRDVTITEEQKDAAAFLLRHIQREVKRIYGQDIPLTRENIVGHNQIAPQHKPYCPGRGFPFEEIIRRATEI